jgi:large subunit ribosomal protein L1
LKVLLRQEDKMKKILEKVKEAKENSKPRKFVQTWDFSINLKGLDLKKPENRFNLEFMLPEGRGKDQKVAFIVDTLETEAKKHADLVIKKSEIAGLVKNKKKLKKIANEYDWFFGEAPLMPLIGKSFGVIFGPRGKVPKPIPPKVSVEPFVKRAKSSVRIFVKESPVVHVSVGTDKMDDEKISKNIEAVYNVVREKLPKGRTNIKSMFIKLTMGKPVRLEVGG